MAKMGLPGINIVFIQKAQSFFTRSEKGIVNLILKDSDTVGDNSFVYTAFDQVIEEWSEENKKYLELCFMGKPNKVFVERILKETEDITDVLKKVANKRWNYMAFPDATEEENTKIVEWLKTKRNVDYKIFKYVGGGLANPNEKGIINWDSDNVIINNKKFTKQQYTSRIAGISAGIPLTQSMTYYVLNEVEGFDELADDTERNKAIAEGKLIAINDGEKIKIARGVNSMVTTSETEGDLFKKIRLLETLDTMREDITTTIRDEWIGKVINDYDNKLLLVASINSYLKVLEGEGLLDINFENLCTIDFEEQRKFLKSIGVKVDDMSEIEILKSNTKDKVFLQIAVKTLDVMEDFKINIYL